MGGIATHARLAAGAFTVGVGTSLVGAGKLFGTTGWQLFAKITRRFSASSCPCDSPDAASQAG